jgi:hypothetical protein
VPIEASGLRREAGLPVLTAGASNWSPTERARSTITNSQWVLSVAICASSSMRKPCSRNGVSTHGRSRSATNMPTLRSVLWIFVAIGVAF